MTEHELTRDTSVDIGGLFARLWRKKWWLVVVPLLATALAWFVLQTVEPRYRAQTDLYFKGGQEILSASSGEESQTTARSLDEQGIASQVEIMKSRRIARDIIAKFDLAGRHEFNPQEGTSPLGGIKAVLGLDEPRGRSPDGVIESYYDRLKVYQANRARVVTVEFSSTDPQLAARVPNAVVAAYLQQQQTLKRGAKPEQLDALRTELAGIKSKLEEAEAAVSRAKAGADVFDGRDGTLATQELSELVSELSRVRSQRARLEARASAIQRALDRGALDSAPGISQSPLIQRLRERLAGLDGQIAELSTTLLPGHPRIRSLRSQRSDLNGQIAREARNILRELQQDTAIASQRERSLRADVDEAKGESSRVRDEQVKLDALQREVDAQRQLYNTYLLRFSEAESRAAREFVPADAVVFSEARVPSQSYFPKTVPVLAGTFVGSFLLTAMIVLATGLAGSARVPATAPVTARPAGGTGGLPAPAHRAAAAVADIAPHRAQNAAPSIAPDMSELSEAPARAVPEHSVAAVARRMSMFGKARIVCASPEGEAGSRGTVLLARSLAKAGFSAVLLDLTANGASSSLMRGMGQAEGFTDAVSGRSDFADCLHNDPASPLHVLPVGRSPLDDAEALSRTLDETLAALDTFYDFVVVDCGGTDVAALSRIADRDSVVIVNAPEGETTAVVEAQTMAAGLGLRDCAVLTPLRRKPASANA